MVDNTGRRCKMSGFANDLVKSDIPVCSGKTVVEVDKHKVLLGLHEAPYLKGNKHSRKNPRATEWTKDSGLAR